MRSMRGETKEDSEEDGGREAEGEGFGAFDGRFCYGTGAVGTRVTKKEVAYDKNRCRLLPVTQTSPSVI